MEKLALQNRYNTIVYRVYLCNLTLHMILLYDWWGLEIVCIERKPQAGWLASIVGIQLKPCSHPPFQGTICKVMLLKGRGEFYLPFPPLAHPSVRLLPSMACLDA